MSVNMTYVQKNANSRKAVKFDGSRVLIAVNTSLFILELQTVLQYTSILWKWRFQGKYYSVALNWMKNPEQIWGCDQLFVYQTLVNMKWKKRKKFSVWALKLNENSAQGHLSNTSEKLCLHCSVWIYINAHSFCSFFFLVIQYLVVRRKQRNAGFWINEKCPLLFFLRRPMQFKSCGLGSIFEA